MEKNEIMLVMDSDMTVTKEFSWSHVREMFGVPLGDHLQEYKDGKLSLKEWCRQDVEGALDAGYNQEEHLDELVSQMKTREGFEEFASYMFPKFDKVAIISAGFPDMVNKFYGNLFELFIKNESDADKYEVFTSTYYRDDKEKVHIDIMNKKKKLDILEEFAKKYNVIYIADDLSETNEPHEFDGPIVRICMANGNAGITVDDFYGAYVRVGEIMANQGKYFK
jgi:2-hydroxy-3-keto-5-methylthiopentenyl-1-phosphate phosphatase